MNRMTSLNPTAKPWNLNDIQYNTIDASRVQSDNFLFTTLVSASLVEIHSQKYSANLIRLFDGDVILTRWLHQYWQNDEVRHGQALKQYVQTVWPDFDWDKAYRGFDIEYSALCTMEQLEQHKALELLARCVVETGTSSFYCALRNYAKEPVLVQLLQKIRLDEISHYAQFRHSFIHYNDRQQHALPALIGTIWRRLRAIGDEDAAIAFKHATTSPDISEDELKQRWNAYRQTLKKLARQHYPSLQAVKMLINPIPMPAPIKQLLQWPLNGIARLITYS